MTHEKSDHAKEQAAAQFESIKELVAAWNAANEAGEGEDTALTEIHNSPLSVMVRDGWRTPGAAAEDGAEEYEILLCTGGPACRIYGKIGQYDEPETAVLQYQNWFTPWTDWYPEDEKKIDEVRCTLLDYAQQFHFGG
jgi:hypothetical protein